MARGSVIPHCITAVYGLPWRLWPTMEDPELPCSCRAAVPLLSRLSALLGAPVGMLILFTMHDRKLHQLLASCSWRAPLLERVLLGGPAERLQAALGVLQQRPGWLAAVPPLLQLAAATLVAWRRATSSRSQRRQVRAVLLCLLALTPPGTPASELGLTPAAAADWRAKMAPLIYVQLTPRLYNRTVMHVYTEFQHVYRAVLSLNEVLDRPWRQLPLVNTLHIPLTMRLGFVDPTAGRCRG